MSSHLALLEKTAVTAYRIRAIERKIAEVYPEAEIRCPTHLSIGQELVPSIVGQHWNKLTDRAVSTHRGHAHYIGLGGDLTSMVLELYGKAGGCSGGRGGSMHLRDESIGFFGTSAIVGNSIPIGVGLSESIDQGGVAVVFLGDGATEEGVFWESVNYAVVRNLPVVFICENNFYSVYTGLDARQPTVASIESRVSAFGVRCRSVDSRNIPSVIEALGDIFDYTREQHAPSFIEVETYRWLEHCGPNKDDDLNYRPQDELAEWLEFDVVRQLEILCKDKELVSIKHREVDKEIEESFKIAKCGSFPDVNEVWLNVYPPELGTPS